MQVTTIGLDIAKNVFQVHGVNRRGKAVWRKQLRRAGVLAFFANLPPCRIGMEACAGAHYGARQLTRLGHEVRLMPPQYVKAYVKTNKHDAADAEACCARRSAPTTEVGAGSQARDTREVGANKAGAKGSSTVYRITGSSPRTGPGAESASPEAAD